jgi:5-methylcytosine-specific restriction endonuclease McrA
MDIITKKEAKARGMNKYFTGKPCKHGHADPRRIHNDMCMGCIRVGGRKWYAQNTAYKLQKSRDAYEKNKENVLARTGLYYQNNKEKYKTLIKEWAKQHPDKMYEYARKWRQKNPTVVAAWNRANHAKRQNSYGTHSHLDVLDRLKWQGGRCAVCCGVLSGKFEVDHYIPLAKGGHNNPSNLQLLCKSCNRRKHAKDPIVFYQSQGFLL